MDHGEGLQPEAANFRGLSGGYFLDAPREAPTQIGGPRKKDVERAREPFPQPGRTRKNKGPGPAFDELAVEEQKRKAAEMIAVKMRDHDGVHGFETEAEFIPRSDCAGAEIHDDARFAGINPNTSMGASAGPECITRSDDCDFHPQPKSLRAAPISWIVDVGVQCLHFLRRRLLRWPRRTI
jgi:hypothetical protein